ncbi:protein kinase subdomain-containing protein PKL [Trametes elegans]|nr:protein kinase subdomain-containing protein PKL [Trametes elegans]
MVCVSMEPWRIIRFLLRLVPAALKPTLFRWAAQASARCGLQLHHNIYCLPFNLILKPTLDVNLNEAQALHIVESVKDVQAPRLVSHAAGVPYSYTLMTRIEGDCCNDVFDELTASDKTRLVLELQTQLAALRQATANRRKTICGASEASISDPRIPWLCEEPRVLRSSQEFFEQVWIGLDLPWNRDTIRPYIRPFIEREDVPIVFCHGDILPKNIILPGGLKQWRKGTTQLFLIDWEYAAWAPLPWEALKATWLVVDPVEDEWYDLMKKVFPESSAELETDWTWRLKSNITII